ncbi:tetratricopeptide repeat protein [Candidatus Gracilibacteria bacterium]|nr:tetratricopeptide repeat protein [Candidatus Gracilibacteria bacterium]NJM89747.1 tetratricopeptide repeat protein [Hydrococcus sp. RU_2_2]NJP19257.1 tetratricopeptide repeat protein [Hydrococcus sp. CRU_1_1]
MNTDSLLQQAFMAFDSGQLTQAEQLYLLAVQQHTETQNEQYKCAVNGLAFTYSLQKRYDRAHELYQNLYELVCYQRDLKWQAIALHQLGMVERLAGNFQEAQQIFQHEYDFRVFNLPDDFVGFSANLYEQGYLHLKLAYLLAAEQAMLKSLEMARRVEDDMCLGCSYRGIGEVYLRLGKFVRAKEAFSLSIKAFERVGDDRAVLEVQELIRKS